MHFSRLLLLLRPAAAKAHQLNADAALTAVAVAVALGAVAQALAAAVAVAAVGPVVAPRVPIARSAASALWTPAPPVRPQLPTLTHISPRLGQTALSSLECGITIGACCFSWVSQVAGNMISSLGPARL